MSAVVVALALAFRLVWVLVVPTRPVGDFALYLESAAHLLAHHSFDAEFIYMPGYVFLLAGVQALGGGLMAAKLIGVAAGGLGAWSVYAITLRLWDRTVAAVAGLLFACWPAGIAVASVTGTDMPGAALLAAAVAILLRDQARGRPWRAAVGFGFMMGLAAYVRAVAVPLAVLALPYWLATTPGRAGIKSALARTAVGGVVAALVLLPWGIRNQLRYGEIFLTDSHGGHTALVGANPNSEGVYSRSLNQLFWKGTGYRLFDPSPRDADRAAYALAKSWAAFEPAYAIGLVAAKADRLLTNERPLLYWPLYRESVLNSDDPARAFFDRHRAAIERLVDGFWYGLAAAAVAGLALAAARREGRALAITLFPLALVGLYATFFSEVRYHLAIAIFMFPFAAAALCGLARRWRAPAAWRERGAAALAVAILLLGWPRLIEAGARLRDRHRWAVCVCAVDGRTRLCNWRATAPAPGTASSPVRGVWDGVGLRARAAAPETAAVSAIDLPPGRYRITAHADRIAAAVAAPASAFTTTRAQLEGDGQALATAVWNDEPGPDPRALSGTVEHMAGQLVVGLRASTAPPSDVTVWLSDIRIERDQR